MKMKHEIIERTVYCSELRPEIFTDDPNLRSTIEWADENPIVWKIVCQRSRSKAFGWKSCFYIGWAQNNNTPGAILERVRSFRDEVLSKDYRATQIWRWRARFTLEHYIDKGFKGGFFQHHDGHYPRNCMTLDYTPETLEEVIDRFEAWACRGAAGTIQIDKKVVRILGREKKKRPARRERRKARRW